MRSPRHTATTILMALLLAGCGATSTPAPSSTPTSAPIPVVEIIGTEPVLDPTSATGYGFMLPGAGVIHEEVLHAWVVGFGEVRGDQEVLHIASSDSGATWEIADRRVEADIGLDLQPPGPVPSSVLAPDGDGDWVMYFSASPDGGVDGADIWRATAPEPGGPWTADPEPVLARADLPTEDGGMPTQLDFPAVVRTDGGYLMLFGWSPSRQSTLIRSATSTDGIGWTVADAPAVDLGLCGGFDTRSVAMPRLAAQPGGGWLALYGAFGEDGNASMVVGSARSADGVTWDCASLDPILDVPDIPGSERVHSYVLLSGAEGLHQLLVESLVSDRSELWLAELTAP